jgi:hypothetical protein
MCLLVPQVVAQVGARRWLSLNEMLSGPNCFSSGQTAGPPDQELAAPAEDDEGARLAGQFGVVQGSGDRPRPHSRKLSLIQFAQYPSAVSHSTHCALLATVSMRSSRVVNTAGAHGFPW